MTGLHKVLSMAIHPGGDNLLVGSKEGKVCWFDIDLLTSPCKTLKNHSKRYSCCYIPQFLSFVCIMLRLLQSVCLSWYDLLQNPLIAPLKVLQGHQSVNGRGILDRQFHPKQPWLFTAGADSVVKLYYN